jgi:arginyl-tRNA synthetase
VERAFTLVTGKNPQLSEQQRASIAAAAGIGGIKYSDLCKDRISDYIFSWEKILSLDGNTAPYLQYAYARVQSIFRKAGIEQTESGEVCLGVPQELALARQILRFGEVIETVARELKPHHLCTYLFELATRFTSFYENCPVLMSDEPVRASRLTLCSLTARTLGLGLSILGIEHPEQM